MSRICRFEAYRGDSDNEDSQASRTVGEYLGKVVTVAVAQVILGTVVVKTQLVGELSGSVVCRTQPSPELAFRQESVPGIRMWQMRSPSFNSGSHPLLTDGSLNAEHDDAP
jgi:hypothetical protein